MTADPSVEEHSWPRARWWLALVLVMALQLGFIFVLSDRSPVVVQKTRPAPTIHVASDEPDELLQLSDPTLFVLPHQQGFSGETWLKIPTLAASSNQWTEPRRWLLLEEETLGTTFSQFMTTNFFETGRFEMMPSPRLTRLEVEPEIMIAGKSSVRLEGALSERRLRVPVEVPPWPYVDVIAPSKVQVLVDAAGNVISSLLLPSENQLEPVTPLKSEADKNAVRLAKTARFEALPRGSPDVTVGVMNFNWQIISPMTNAVLEK